MSESTVDKVAGLSDVIESPMSDAVDTLGSMDKEEAHFVKLSRIYLAHVPEHMYVDPFIFGALSSLIHLLF